MGDLCRRMSEWWEWVLGNEKVVVFDSKVSYGERKGKKSSRRGEGTING